METSEKETDNKLIINVLHLQNMCKTLVHP